VQSRIARGLPADVPRACDQPVHGQTVRAATSRFRRTEQSLTLKIRSRAGCASSGAIFLSRCAGQPTWLKAKAGLNIPGRLKYLTGKRSDHDGFASRFNDVVDIVCSRGGRVCAMARQFRLQRYSQVPTRSAGPARKWPTRSARRCIDDVSIDRVDRSLATITTRRRKYSACRRCLR